MRGRNLPVLSMAISLLRPVPHADSCLIPKKPTTPASRYGWRYVPKIATPRRRMPLGRVPLKMDELAVRSACAWKSKIAKCRRPQELVIRHEHVIPIFSFLIAFLRVSFPCLETVSPAAEVSQGRRGMLRNTWRACFASASLGSTSSAVSSSRWAAWISPLRA